jgi:hypothetical protein
MPGFILQDLYHTQDPWYLNVFTEEALPTHQSSVWDNALVMDDELNFTDMPTSSWFPAQVQFEFPGMAVREEAPIMYRD